MTYENDLSLQVTQHKFTPGWGSKVKIALLTYTTYNFGEANVFFEIFQII